MTLPFSFQFFFLILMLLIMSFISSWPHAVSPVCAWKTQTATNRGLGLDWTNEKNDLRSANFTDS